CGFVRSRRSARSWSLGILRFTLGIGHRGAASSDYRHTVDGNFSNSHCRWSILGNGRAEMPTSDLVDFAKPQIWNGTTPGALVPNYSAVPQSLACVLASASRRVC